MSDYGIAVRDFSSEGNIGNVPDSTGHPYTTK